MTSILPLTLDNVSLEIEGMRLIKDITCHLERGPRTIIIGSNGAGKSLLLRLCHGLVQPTEGRVLWHGNNGGNPALAQAMVFQRPVMLRRSVTANISYALDLHQVPISKRQDRIRSVLDKTGLGRLADKQARVLSIGEQQRLALARVWAINPEVLFLDEPTASLDPAASHQVEQVIQAIHDAGTKIIMTTHDMGQAKRLGDEIIFLHRGRIKEQASAEKFFDQPKNDLAEAFLKGELLWWHRSKDNIEPSSRDWKNGDV